MRIAAAILEVGIVVATMSASDAAQIRTAPDRSDLCIRFEPEWSAIEKNLWTQQCRKGWASGANVPRAIASTDAADSKSEQVQPGEPTKQPVHASFLETLLTKNPYRTQTAKTGLHFDAIDIDGPLRLTGTTIVGDIDLSFFRASTIRLDAITLEGSLRLKSGAITRLWMVSPHIKGSVRLLSMQLGKRSSCFPNGDGQLSTESLEVDRDFVVMQTHFEQILLNAVRVGQWLYIIDSAGTHVSLEDAHVTGPIKLINLSLDNNKPISCEVYRIFPMWLSMNVLSLDGLETTSLVDLTSARINGPASISDATIVGSLILSAAQFHSRLKVSDTRIGRKLVLETVSTQRNGMSPHEAADIWWGPRSGLSLKNTSINVIAAPRRDSSWPPQVDLRNLTFNGYASDVSDAASEVAATEWFPRWLSKSVSSPYNPQPYERVRMYLTSVGEGEAANAVGVAGKNLELKQACERFPYAKCAFLAISWATIGYGYALWRAAIWSAGFIIVGALVFRRTDEAYQNSLEDSSLAYSFDMFLPLVKLREKHYAVDIASRARYYFYIHKLAGWVLGSFLVAAVAGLTK